MKKFSNNSFAALDVHGETSVIDVFSGVSGKKKILIWDNAHFTYLLLAKSSCLDLSIDVQGSNVKCQIFVLFVSDAHVALDAKVITHISGTSVKVQKHVLSLLWEQGHISADAHIDIAPWIKAISAHLLEENIVFGQHVSVKSLPALSVASRDVHASHAAKIEKINHEKLFYMSSKWLSQEMSQRLVVDGYVNDVLSYFVSFDDQELSLVREFVQFLV